MATKEDKKPLIVPEAGNAAATDPKNVQDYAKPDNQVGAGWAGNQSATVSPSTGTTQNDGTKTLSYDQVKEFEKTGTVSGRDPNNPNVGPGGVNMKMGLLPSGTNFGVLAGAPSQVVIQHMLDAERKPRTPEEQENLEKKRKRDALFAAIGDGVSALSNLYFTTKGSPSADQSKSLSKAIRERDDKDDKEYDTAMDRRMKLLKEQLADRNRIEELKIKEQLAENLKEHRANQHQIGMDKNAETNRHNTVMEVQDKENKQAEAKRKADKDKADKERQDKEADNRNKNRDRNASTNAAKAGEQKRHNQETERQGRERNQETQRHHQETEKNQKNKGGKGKKPNPMS